MLDQTHRFHGLNSLTFAYRRGQTIRNSQLSLKYVLNERRQTYRVAVVVSRKVDKSAVVRNRIRRRIYEVIRTQTAVIEKPYDLVFTVFSPLLADLETIKLQQLLGEQLRKANVVTSPKAASRAIVNPKE